MSGTRFSPRTIWLVLADAAIIYGGIILALYLRLGFTESEFQLVRKKRLAQDRTCYFSLFGKFIFPRSLRFYRNGKSAGIMLRLVQAIGIAWVFLALLFYFVPPLLIGRGVLVISVPMVLVLLLMWRVLIHLLTGHPEIGEKILIVGTGNPAHRYGKIGLGKT